MITTWADLFFAILPFGTGIAGYLIGGWASRVQIRNREAARRDLAAELRSPVDLEPCEFSHDWSVR